VRGGKPVKTCCPACREGMVLSTTARTRNDDCWKIKITKKRGDLPSGKGKKKRRPKQVKGGETGLGKASFQKNPTRRQEKGILSFLKGGWFRRGEWTTTKKSTLCGFLRNEIPLSKKGDHRSTSRSWGDKNPEQRRGKVCPGKAEGETKSQKPENVYNCRRGQQAESLGCQDRKTQKRVRPVFPRCVGSLPGECTLQDTPGVKARLVAIKKTLCG